MSKGSTTCTIEGCDRPHQARGLCRAHYKRWKKHGDPGPALVLPRDPVFTLAGLLARCRPEPCMYPELGPCLVWPRAVTDKGYPRVCWRGRTVRAHKLAYELARGRLLPGLLVTHRCDNPTCCNPEHLLAGTQAENMLDMVRRGRGG